MAKIELILSTVFVTCVLLVNSIESSQQLKTNIENALLKLHKNNSVKEQVPCTCGVFLTGQFKRGSSDPPKGNPALMHEQELNFQCNAAGVKQCTNRCLEMVNANSFPTSKIENKFFVSQIFIYRTDCQAFVEFSSHYLWYNGSGLSQGASLLIHSEL